RRAARRRVAGRRHRLRDLADRVRRTAHLVGQRAHRLRRRPRRCGGPERIRGGRPRTCRGGAGVRPPPGQHPPPARRHRAALRKARLTDTLDRLRLVRAEGVGPVVYRRLMKRYRTAAAALDALPGLARAGGRTAPTRIPTPDEASRELAALAKLGAKLLFLDQPDYPPLLALLDDAPPMIAVLGDTGLLAKRAVALVGGRNASVNGTRIAEALGADLARTGLAVVSGLARGIDAAAHTGAMRDGRTVGVVAGGIDVPYPPGNGDMHARIAAEGAVVAESALGTAPQARHFPRRNRIIAGLSLGVVVVEAALRSGSLITARLAAETGREVLAVPGSPLDPRARGANDLIRQGAALVETVADVLANLPDHPAATPAPLFAPHGAPDAAPGFAELPPPDPDFRDSAPDRAALYAQVLDLLGPSPTPVDAVVRRCQFSAPAVMAALLELELAGRVETLPGGRVAALLDPIA